MINITLVHIDTGHNFPEVLEYRDNLVKIIEEKQYKPTNQIQALKLA